jgi:hypothetical protein
MDTYRKINDYFDKIHFKKWSIIGCLKYISLFPGAMVTSADKGEVRITLKNVIKARCKSKSLLANARAKLERLESSFESTWKRHEVGDYFDKLDLTHAKVSVKGICRTLS